MATTPSLGTAQVHRTPLDWIAGTLVIIGALNWGPIGLLQLDVVAAIFGSGTVPTRIVYVLVGIAGIYCLVRAFMPPKSGPVASR
ncbi:DUF378 domain-containing protein (plasmid) [Paraburkholderia sprentiae WSM5005]|uniref:DUF378 domain-containing protein n=1 Tax=Paraburkholderia sprentiae WSM5005 TaxID=754502 RepID=A0A1I9YWP4_9BURK|nr:DUF378 domain-containing protein [Paraburkholderia sprentiae]APA90637.1 DUF378 domain-containing protein [Paraburkholderia sprentiae WSM5005]